MSDPVTTKAAGAVTQADREAAAERIAIWGDVGAAQEAHKVRQGDWDQHGLVQAFARHRTSATADLLAVVGEARDMLHRYRHETPLGNQPSMIAHKADALLTRLDAILAGDAA